MQTHQVFDWEKPISVAEKVDGSLALLYCYKKKWRFNTRGSFAEGEVNECGKSWMELMWGVLDRQGSDLSLLDDQYTYVMEFVSPFNKVVRLYKEPDLYLLAVIRNENGSEIEDEVVDKLALSLNVKSPKRYQFQSAGDILSWLREKESDDPTFEGFVVTDSNRRRVKFKTSTYVALHHLKDNGNICNPKRLVPLVLAGDVDETIAYLPEIEPYVRDVEARINEEWTHLLNTWKQFWKIAEQKEFALEIRGKTKFTGLLFTLRKQHGDKQTEELLREAWRNHADGITKVLYN